MIYQYDVNSWWKGNTAFWLLCPLLVLNVTLLALWIRELSRIPRSCSRLVRMAAVLVGSTVASIGATSTVISSWSLADSSKWKVVCGDIEQFTTEDAPNTGKERFSVGGVLFDYWDKGPPGIGYHKTRSRGGVLGPGMKLRISYARCDEWNVILRAEHVGSCE